MRCLAALCLAVLASATADIGRAMADAASVPKGGVAAQTGEGVYEHVCQGCHMANARGAVGAARIPALAGDARLAASSYPIVMVLKGNGGMPWFNGVLTDDQVAAVVNYVRTHFDNSYAGGVTAGDVGRLRGPAPTMER